MFHRIVEQYSCHGMPTGCHKAALPRDRLKEHSVFSELQSRACISPCRDSHKATIIVIRLKVFEYVEKNYIISSAWNWNMKICDLKCRQLHMTKLCGAVLGFFVTKTLEMEVVQIRFILRIFSSRITDLQLGYISFLNRGTGKENILMHFRKSVYLFFWYQILCKLLSFIQSLLQFQVASNWIVWILLSSLRQYKYNHS
jgi:hypothetical protein